MRNSFRHISCSLIAMLLTVCCNQKNGDTAHFDQEEQAVKETLVAMWEAIEKEDMESYALYIHPDFSQFGETDSLLRIGKEAELEGIKAWIAEASNIHTEMLEPRVTVRGDVAWIVYYWQDRGINSKGSFSSKGKSTRIFVKEKGSWQCIHGHYTLLSQN